MQTLLDLSIADTFPRQCNEWHAIKKDISDSCSENYSTRQRIAFEEFTSEEHEMRRVLYDAVVGDVLKLFPCVLFVSTPTHKILRQSPGHWNVIASLPTIGQQARTPAGLLVRI